MTGLQTGLIDTVAAPPVGALALQWFTKATYLTDLPITYVCGTMAIGAKTFAKLSPGDQDIVREVFGKANATLDKRSRTDNQEARERSCEAGGGNHRADRGIEDQVGAKSLQLQGLNLYHREGMIRPCSRKSTASSSPTEARTRRFLPEADGG